MLTAEQKEKLKGVLVAEKARLLRNAQEGLSFSMNRDRDKVGRDSIDESAEEEMFSTELRLRDREKWLLGKINSSLERLEAGTINECEDCSEEIGYKRLVARPVTTLCIGCKEEREREERAEAQVGGGGREGLGGLAAAGGSFGEGGAGEGGGEPVALPED
jgi:DnaK suppressor protein